MTGAAVLQHSVTVIGGGPAGLMAAEVLAQQGVKVDVYDSMPTVGRKFLLAGRGGLNLTHAESREEFVVRYGGRQAHVESWLQAFAPADVREWVHALRVETFVGSSGRVFRNLPKVNGAVRCAARRPCCCLLRQKGFHSSDAGGEN